MQSATSDTGTDSHDRELILGLKETERLLPDSVPEADRRAFLDCIALVSDEELGFYNLVTGESGAAPDYPHFAYCRRIDNSVNSIKKRFTKLNLAIQHIERDLRMKAASTQENPTPKRKSRSIVTKADLRSAVKTILTSEEVDPPKPGPQITKARRNQIAAAKTYKKTHCGCTLRNACIKSFVHVPGGYASGLSMYESLRRRMGE